MNKALINTHCMMKACDTLRIPYTIHDTYGNFVEVHAQQPLFFINFATPWNDASAAALCRDKEYTYRLLSPHMRIPKTTAYFDPQFNRKNYKQYHEHTDRDAIIRDITTQHIFPLIIKMNSGSRKRNVFLCHNEKDIRRALNSIFNKRSRNYDYLALAQEYINIQTEYRVVMFKKQILCVYIKNDAKRTLIHDQNVIAKLRDFIRPIFEKTTVQFAGLDVAQNVHDELFLLEMNAEPGFFGLARAHGEDVVVKMFEEMLKSKK